MESNFLLHPENEEEFMSFTHQDLMELQRSEGTATSLRRSSSLADDETAAANVASSDQSTRIFPSLIIKSVRYMLSYVLFHMANVVTNKEVALWRLLLDVGMAAQQRSQDDDVEDVNWTSKRNVRCALLKEDLLTRLCCRKPNWFSMQRLENDYSSMAEKYCVAATEEEDDDDDESLVPRLLQELSNISVETAIRGAGNKCGDILMMADKDRAVQIFDGSHFVDLVARGERDSAMQMLQCVRIPVLRELAMHLRRHEQQQQQQEAPQQSQRGSKKKTTAGTIKKNGVPTAAAPTAAANHQSHRHNASSTSNAASTRKGNAPAAAAAAAGGAAPNSTATASMSNSHAQPLDLIPDRRDDLISWILHHAASSVIAQHAWNATAGHMVRVHPELKAAVQQLLRMFHLIAEYYPVTGGSGGNGGSSAAPSLPPVPPSNLAVLATLGLITQPMQLVLPRFKFDMFLVKSETITPIGKKDDTSEAVAVVPELLLCESREELNLFMAALALQCQLFDACEGYQRFKMKDVSFINSVEQQIEKALARLDVLNAQRKIQRRLSRRGRHRDDDGSRQHQEVEGRTRSATTEAWLTVPEALQRYGYDAYYLARYLPVYRWLACVEYLYECFQAQHAYEKANHWLRILLDRPVFDVRCPPSVGVVKKRRASGQRDGSSGGAPILFSMCYRYQARGKWIHRWLQNLCHLGPSQTAQALSSVESILQQYTNEKARQEAIDAQTERLLRLATATTIPSSNDASSSSSWWSVDQCKRYARTDIVQKRFLRRADRMSLERLQVRLHKPPRRWGPLPKTLLVSNVKEAPVRFLNGERDPNDIRGWNQATSVTDAGSSVEQFVLRWYEKGRGRREIGWKGLHVEGSWFSLLTEIVFIEAFSWSSSSSSSVSGGGGRVFGNSPCHGEDATPKEENDDDTYARRVSSTFLWLSPFQSHAFDASDMAAFVARRKDVIASCIESIRGMSNDAFFEFVSNRIIVKSTAARVNIGVEDADVEGDGGGGDDNENVAAGNDNSSNDGDDADVSTDDPIGAGNDGVRSADGVETAREDPQDVDTPKSNLKDDDDDDGCLLFDQDVEEDTPQKTRDEYNKGVEEEEEEDKGEAIESMSYLPLGQEEADTDGTPRHEAKPPPSASPSSLQYRVDISRMPEILDMVRCIPVDALCTLYTTMFFSDPCDGYVLRYSGFPDLVMWRRVDPAAWQEHLQRQQSSGSSSASSLSRPPPETRFQLVEVKSPNDKLSDKQVAVNDLLLRSGFDVSIVSIVNRQKIEADKAPRVRIIKRAAPQHVAALVVNKRRSSSFIRGTPTNPLVVE